jgi:hypothetical protein
MAAMKRVWITSLSEEITEAAGWVQALHKYAIAADGRVWDDNIKERAWFKVSDVIAECDLWLILGRDEDLANDTIRYGLSLTALEVQARKGHGFPIFLANQGELPTAEALPTPLRGAQVFKSDDPKIAAKMTARVSMAPKKVDPQYRLALHAPPVGVCYELGPVEGKWDGVLFAISADSGEIAAQAPGPVGKPPETATLEYPMKDIKLSMGGQDYVAVAVKNSIETDSSYYAVVNGEPSSILFGPFSYDAEEQADFFSIRLK